MAGNPMSQQDERQYALFLHLSSLATILGIPSIIGPLVMWLIKKDDSAFVDRHGKAAVNFHLSVYIYGAVAVAAIAVIAIATLGIGVLLLLPVIILGAIAAFLLLIVLPIVAGLKASNGEEYTYPLTIRLLK